MGILFEALTNIYGRYLELQNTGLVVVSNWWKDICNLIVVDINIINEYSVKEVYMSLNSNDQSISTEPWFKVWNRAITLKLSCMLWKLLSNRFPMKDNLAKRGVLSLGQLGCVGKCGSEESVSQIFF